jgi:phosphatidate cytidylyltransferase
MRKRVATALILAPVVLAALCAPISWPLGALAFIVGLIGARELLEMPPEPGVRVPWLAALALVAPLVALGGLQPLPWWSYPLALLAGMIGVRALIAGRRGPVWTQMATVYVAAPIAMLIDAHARLSPGEWAVHPVLLAVLPVWAGDTAAIFAGRAIGRRKLAPTISPGKTWEGAVANLVAAVVAAVLVGAAADVAPLPSLLAGLAAGILGQAGDLLESRLKREFDLKDSGDLLPGHGGLLDRLDSLLLAMPASLVILLAWR